ncbi:MAG: alternative ribosome rescue aminoacyl-tRNA hydrolase ArfB [Mariniblastus sp.]|jgi:ribosome-associated protein|nr:alternative ribosome rescue aminoacyl-tRNA hydrolase ArfB [Mariniblastus sp.]
MLKVNRKISIRLAEFKFSFARSPGPGGQNVNKVNSKAVLKWSPAKCKSLPEAVRIRFIKKYANRINQEEDFVISSHRFRDQGRNVADCLNKLRDLIIQVAELPKPRKQTRPTAGSVRRRLTGKKRLSDIKKSRRTFQGDD